MTRSSTLAKCGRITRHQSPCPAPPTLLQVDTLHRDTARDTSNQATHLKLVVMASLAMGMGSIQGTLSRRDTHKEATHNEDTHKADTSRVSLDNSNRSSLHSNSRRNLKAVKAQTTLPFCSKNAVLSAKAQEFW